MRLVILRSLVPLEFQWRLERLEYQPYLVRLVNLNNLADPNDPEHLGYQ